MIRDAHKHRLEEFYSYSVLAERLLKETCIRCLLWTCDPGSGLYSGFSVSFVSIPDAWSEINQPAAFPSVGPARESQTQRQAGVSVFSWYYFKIMSNP